jgi:hypothetical protein
LQALPIVLNLHSIVTGYLIGLMTELNSITRRKLGLLMSALGHYLPRPAELLVSALAPAAAVADQRGS